MIARRIWLYTGTALVLGIVAGAAWPPPPLPKLDTQDGEWNLPAASDIARHIPQDLATVAANLRWKGDAGGTRSERSAWRLAGTINEATPAILVMTPDKRDEALRIELGKPLPDGSLLHAVQGDRAITKRDACITTYQLFQEHPVETSNGCEEPEATDQGTRK